jgi:hypothetical protein
MPAKRFERIALAQLMLSGCAVMFGACVLIESAQAQQPSVPSGPIPTPPTQSPTLNPSNPGTVPQPSYRPVTPSTPSITPTTPSTPSVEVTPPANEEHPSTTAQPEQPPVAKTRTVHHHHRGLYIGVGPSLGSFDCSYFGWCVRISPPYAYYQRYGWYRY